MYEKARFMLAASAFALSAFATSMASAQESFGYACTDCPASWPTLDILNNNCGGSLQSPIAFSRGDAKFKRRHSRLSVDYGEDVRLLEETLSTNIEWKDEMIGDNTVRLRGSSYEFLQFHFHSTAEHVVNGERSDLEMHFVNQAADESLLVLAVFIKEGDENAAFDPIITSLETAGEQDVHVDLRALLPRRLASFRYIGSTTTPPCVGGVRWVLLKQHVELSGDQMKVVQDEIRDINGGFDNNRTIQNRERRVIRMVRQPRRYGRRGW